MSAPKSWWQGDLLITQVDIIPDNAKLVKTGNPVLAEGEATGHSHVLESDTAELYETLDAVDRYLRVHQTAPVTHQQHPSQMLEPGDYIVMRQVETHGELRRYVAD